MAKNHLIVASLNQKLYTTMRLLEEAKKLKRSPIYLNPYECHLTQQGQKLSGTYLHRTTGTNYDDFDLVVSTFHEDAGLKVTNPLSALKTFRSKDLQSLYFNKHNIPSIPTLLYRGLMNDSLRDDIHELARDGRFILKMSRGNQGIGVNFLESAKSLHSVLETFHAMKDQRFIIQPFIEHKKEWRLFMIKGEITACIEKTLSKDDFRGNSKRSTGKILKKIPADLVAIAEKAFNHSALDYAGVDLLESTKGEILMLEMNPVPGFEQAEELSGKNIARELVTLL